MYKVFLMLECGEFYVYFDTLNECYEWLVPILVTDNWLEYDIFDSAGHSVVLEEDEEDFI